MDEGAEELETEFREAPQVVVWLLLYHELSEIGAETARPLV